MREICTSGSMSGEWKRSMAELVRHRQTKEPETDRLRLNHRATPRLYLDKARAGMDAGTHASPTRKRGNPRTTRNRLRKIERLTQNRKKKLLAGQLTEATIC